jgi:salicylate hydroxylase
MRLGTRVEDFAVHQHGVTVQVRTAQGLRDEQGIALVGADGLWSMLRARLGDHRTARFAHRTAWRAIVPAERVSDELREPVTGLWLGRDAHLVHYPIMAGAMLNIVAIVRDGWQEAGWTAPGKPADLLPRFKHFAPAARTLLALPDNWQKWALFDRALHRVRGNGPVTLLGDAAHPMLPFLAQGGAMAVEDAAVLADCLRQDEDPARAFRSYEHARARRVARVQREARRNSWRYHLSGPLGFARDMFLRMMGGEKLLRGYDWLYDWKP